MKKLLTFVSLLILASVSGLAQDKGGPASKITYSLIEDERPGVLKFTALRATENGESYQLIDKSKDMCLEIVDQRDFDGNGFVDALVRHIVSCGGNGSMDSFFFVSAFGNGRFELSDEFSYTWDEPVIENWKGHWSVVVTSGYNIGAGNLSRPDVVKQRFILESGKAILVEDKRRKDIKSIIEMRSEMFVTDNEDETHSIEYDLDGDGRKDRIKATLWWRWGTMLWDVEFADGRIFSSKCACKRIGVLKTKTNGVNDIVCDQDMVLRWNGREYIEAK